MRQVGILGAAGHFALDNNIARLAEDHQKAKILAEQIHHALPSAVDPKHVLEQYRGIEFGRITSDGSRSSCGGKENREY